MENLLTPDKGLILWTLASFLVLVFVLGKFAWKPLIGALSDREQGIRRAIEEAASARQTADQLRSQYEAELAKGQSKVQEMLSLAQADAQRARDQILKQAQEEAQRIASQTRSQMEEDKAKIARELRRDVAGISIQAAEKLLRHSMNAKEQEALLQEFFKEIDKEGRKS